MKRRIRTTDIVNLALLLVELGLYYTMSRTYSKPIVIFCVLVCLYETVIILKNIKHAMIRPVSFLVLSYFIVNCQVYTDLIFGILTPDAKIFIRPNLITKGALLSAVCATALGIGYTNTRPTKRKLDKKPFSNSKLMVYNVMTLVSFVLWLSGLSAEDLSGDSYSGSGSYDSGARFYVEILFQTMLFLSLVYYSKRPDIPKNLWAFLKGFPKLTMIAAGMYMLFRLMSGDRGPAIYTAILLLFVYTFKTKKTMKMKVALPLLVVGAIVMTSISLTRGMGSEVGFREKMTYAVEDSDALEDAMRPSLCPFTAELAGSLGCTHQALDETVNYGRPFHYGVFHMCYLIKFIPFLGTEIVTGLGIPKNYQSSSEYVTVARFGPLYRSGMGTSTIADDYLEFGVWGVLIGLLFIGFIFKKVDTALLRCKGNEVSASLLLLVYTMCYGCFYIPRGTFFMYFRTWLYAWAVMVFVNLIFLPFEGRTKIKNHDSEQS